MDCKVKSTQYLFGIEPKKFKNMSYEEVLKLKINAGKKLLKELTDKAHNIKDYEEYVKVVMRQKDVSKAIEHNECLLKELIG